MYPVCKFLIKLTYVACVDTFPKYRPCYFRAAYSGNFLSSWILGFRTYSRYPHVCSFFKQERSIFDSMTISIGAILPSPFGRLFHRYDVWLSAKIHVRISNYSGQSSTWCSIIVRVEFTVVYIAHSATTFCPWEIAPDKIIFWCMFIIFCVNDLVVKVPLPTL